MGSHGRRRATILVLYLCAVAAASWPSFAAGKSATRSLRFTTGQFAVYCTSRGELCRPAEKLSFKLGRAGTLTSIAYSTARTHCSSVQVHVLRRGHQIAQTAPLAAGLQTVTLNTNIHLPRGTTTLGFQAQGFVGGCNAGLLASWGGIVTVTVRVPV